MKHKGFYVRTDRWPVILVPSSLVFDPKLDARDVRLWCALRFYAGAQDYTWVSKERLAKELGMGTRTIYYRLRVLEEAKWLARGKNEDGRPVIELRNKVDALHPGAAGLHAGAVAPCTPVQSGTAPPCSLQSTQYRKPTTHPGDGKKKKKKKKARSKLALSPAESMEFESWWAVYPKHTRRAAARGAWREARSKWPSIDALLVATRLWLDQHPVSEVRYLPAPATWLREERWTDEAGEAVWDAEGWEARAKAEEEATRRELEEQRNA